jgi:hypothetical protein
MPNPVFTLGANVITFHKGPDYPVRTPREQLQVLDRTAAGTLEIETLGAMIETLPVSFSNLTAAEYAALANWFENVSQGAANAFVYSDADGIDHDVRWVNGFDFQETKSGFSGTIELEIV